MSRAAHDDSSAPHDRPRWSERTLNAERSLPTPSIASSRDLGWRSLLARVHDEPADVEEFTTMPTPDFLVILLLSGSYRVEAKDGGRWVGLDSRPGSMGMFVPEKSATMRWRGSDPARGGRTVQMHLGNALLDATAEALGMGRPADALPDGLGIEDPTTRDIGRAIVTALRSGVEPLAGDSLATAMAVRLLRLGPRAGREPRARGGGLGSVLMSRVVEYMVEHLAEPVTLDELAAVALMSKYHFVRNFSVSSGETPYRHLTRLRIERAAHLLRTTSLPVADVWKACGYRSAGPFNAAFRRLFGCSPTAYRAQR